MSSVLLRFFGGLSVEETAEVLKISEETVMRDWKFAKNWLMRELSRGVRRGSDWGQTRVRQGSDPMTAPDRISEIYHRALERPPGDRTAFLQHACGGDARCWR
jgi:hypothetical protein